MISYRGIILFLFFCIAYARCKAQDGDLTPDIRKADSLYKLRRYKQSAKFYFRAFRQIDGERTNENLLNAAKASARSRYTDSAYQFLFIIVQRKAREYFDDIIYEDDFRELHRDKQWALLSSKIDNLRISFNTPVSAELIAMYKHRVQMDLHTTDILKKYGNNSTRFKEYSDSVTQSDTVNALKLKTIINTYGWLGPAKIGADGVKALIYTFQKTNLQFQKHYFPLVVTAFKKGDVDANDFAIIADRVSLFDTGRQIYGTQHGANNNLYLIDNKDSVNSRRVAIGLDTLR